MALKFILKDDYRKIVEEDGDHITDFEPIMEELKKKYGESKKSRK